LNGRFQKDNEFHYRYHFFPIIVKGTNGEAAFGFKRNTSSLRWIEIECDNLEKTKWTQKTGIP
jgi:hypothetical protein